MAQMAQMTGAAGKFLDSFDTTTKEKREKCLPLGPPGGVPKSLGAWAPPGPPRGLKKKPGTYNSMCFYQKI